MSCTTSCNQRFVIGKGKSKRVTLQSVVMLEIHSEYLDKQKHKRRKSRAAGSLCARKTCPIIMFDSKYIYSSILDSNWRTSYLQETYKDLFVAQKVYIYALNAAVIGQQRANTKRWIFKIPISNRKYEV